MVDPTVATERYIDDEEDEEKDVCRICRNPGDASKPLRYPCACSGSIKFVHLDCLNKWLIYRRNTRHCEVCKHPFSSSPLYAENAPTRLPIREFVLGAAKKALRCRTLRLLLTLCFLLSVRLLTVEFVTFRVWRFAFVRSFGEAQRLFVSHISATVILTDCFLGSLLSTCRTFIFVGATSLRDYFRHLRELGGQDERDDEGERNGVPAAARRRPAGDEDAAAADGAQDVPGPMFPFVKETFTALASNVLFIGGVNFVPFTLGRFIFYLCADGSSKLSDFTTMIVGYMVIVFLVFVSLGIIALIRYAKGEPLTVGRFYGIVEAMRFGIRCSFFVVVVLGVYPLMCGWWLDVYTVMMFGKTMSHGLEFLSLSPLVSSLVHWVVGLMYVLQASYIVCLLGEVLRPGVLDFLIDPEDDDATLRDLIDVPVHKLAREVLLDFAIDGSLIVMLVFLPVKFAIWMAPSIFPLDLSVSDPFTEILAGMILFQICIPFIIEHFETTVKSLLCCWFTGVGWALGLTDFLLPRPEENINQGNGNGEPGRQNRAQVLQVGGPDRAMAAHPASGNVRNNFVVRIILLLLVSSVTLLLFNSALIVVPVSLGRALFSAISILPITHGIKCNDMYAFVIGTYAFWTSISGARYAIEHVKSKSNSVLLNDIWKWCGIVFKSSVLLAIWVFIIPVLVGLLFELLVIVPMRVPLDESPVFFLFQDWALGLIFLKIWTRLVMLDHMLPIVGRSWRAKFERVREDGFSRLQVLWVLREIVFPIVMKLLTALCVPYVLSRGVFPMLGCPLVVNSAVYRFAWIGCLSVSLFCFWAKLWFTNLHNSIRDERYLIGRRLHNFGEVA